MRGADLTQTAGLTREQLETACIDAQTKLPIDLGSHQEELIARSAKIALAKPKSSFPSTRPPYRQKARKKIWTQSLEPGDRD
jgi:hypothetical protein